MDTILVVDDEIKIADVVKSYLESSGYTVFTANTGGDALSILGKHSISLILLDLMLPDISGEEICKKIRKSSLMPIIMMTAKVDDESVINGLNMGADDYVTKPFSPRQLVARVGATLRRTKDAKSGGKIMTHRGLTIDTDCRTVTIDSSNVTLTPNEYKILILLLSRPNKIFTRDEIISAIKSDDSEVFDRAVDSHIKNLRQKIEQDSKAPKYIVTVYGLGYKMGYLDI